ncbi:hypothetical protein C5F50_07225 [Nitrosopumilus ureiphilus]|uniref:Uncharacterized protein n=1 Tax=Nitrosopumilus ureiphilus TaxID=1470067 RepID=A0A7D5M8A5_9ARCH|nr:hypothetical protein C5F50_07225 [Nitrosopumilus ureiphilus]
MNHYDIYHDGNFLKFKQSEFFAHTTPNKLIYGVFCVIDNSRRDVASFATPLSGGGLNLNQNIKNKTLKVEGFLNENRENTLIKLFCVLLIVHLFYLNKPYDLFYY